ncbi:MAG TPA: NAD-dependent epimerase/dehydratase family protein [Caulobacteraceae bacterium]|nr:NAD-dependent epimerase/dehydratase family protein [Caulobacteraceae bacterium]
MLAVTGASGYIGRRLAELAVRQGWTVVTLGRGRPPFPGLRHFPFDLADPILPRWPTPPTAFVHLACDTSGLDADRLDLPTARLLAQAFADSPTRLVFASSQTASHAAPTPYGRAKAAVEDILRPSGAIIIRPGLVYGGQSAGLWGAIRKIVAFAPVLPALIPAPQVQPIHIDDLCFAILSASAGAAEAGATLAVAAPEPISITDFLRAVARRDRRHRMFMPIPTAALMWTALAAASIAPPLRPMARQILSLTRLPRMVSTADLHRLGLEPRSLAAGMAGRTGHRRQRLIEGACTLRHLLAAPAPSGALRRYVRASEALNLSPAPHVQAWRLRLYAPTLRDAGLANFGLPADLPVRLRLALVIADGSAQTAPAFYRLRPQPPPIALLGLLCTVACELPFLLARLLFGAKVKAR